MLLSISLLQIKYLNMCATRYSQSHKMSCECLLAWRDEGPYCIRWRGLAAEQCVVSKGPPGLETFARHYMVLWIHDCAHIHTGFLSEAVKLIITYADSKCPAQGLVARCSPGGLFKGTHCQAARPRHIDAIRSFVSSCQETFARHYLVL